jgi:hypothetical protein
MEQPGLTTNWVIKQFTTEKKSQNKNTGSSEGKRQVRETLV